MDRIIHTNPGVGRLFGRIKWVSSIVRHEMLFMLPNHHQQPTGPSLVVQRIRTKKDDVKCTELTMNMEEEKKSKMPEIVVCICGLSAAEYDIYYWRLNAAENVKIWWE